MSDQNYLSSSTFQAIFANCRRYWLNYGYELSRDDGVTLFRTGVAHPQLNGVMCLDGDDMDALIQESLKQLSGMPSAWWIGPDSRPDASDMIALHGGIKRGKVPVYAIRLADLPAIAIPDEISIEEITGKSGILEWVECFSPSMSVAPNQVDRMKQAELNRRDAPGAYRRFAAKIDGKMVGTSAFLDADGVAGIYLCSTLEEHRRKGIATLLTLRAAQAGREHGLDVATLQASPLGEPVYRRLGFHKVAEYDFVVF